MHHLSQTTPVEQKLQILPGKIRSAYVVPRQKIELLYNVLRKLLMRLSVLCD